MVDRDINTRDNDPASRKSARVPQSRTKDAARCQAASFSIYRTEICCFYSGAARFSNCCQISSWSLTADH
jgi:hypothetical protein